MSFISLVLISVLPLSLPACDDKPVSQAWQQEEGGEKEKPEEPEIVGPQTGIEAIRNPERGYNLESNYFAHDLANPWHGVSYPELWIPKIESQFDTRADSLTLTQLTFYISEFVGTDISDEAFDNMQTVFDDARERGYKIHIVFAYDYNPYATSAVFSDVFRHLEQLRPFVAKNIGMIDLWRMGFIGAWGEGHSSAMSDDWANKTKLVKAILDGYPDRFMALRYPSHLAKFSGLPAEYAARVGYTNDYFTASEHPRAPENDYTFGSADYAQVREKAPYVKVVGEIPYNENTEWGLDFLISVPNSIRALKEHHYSALDVTQNNELNFAEWKRAALTPKQLRDMNVLFDDSYFRNEKGELVARSAYQFIRDHLGYRLYVDFDKTVIEAGEGVCKYDITLYNTGFSTILNPRPVELVFVDEQGDISLTMDLDGADPRDWQPCDPEKNDFKQIYHSIKGNVPVSLSGKFKVGLLLPDPTDELKEIPEYSMVFANTEIIYTDKYRINIIGEIVL